MQAGQMRWPITIQSKISSTPNPQTGEITYTWEDYVKTYADIAQIARRGSRAAWEAVIASQIKAQKVAQFDIRYIPSKPIDETMRIIDYFGRIWDIKTIVNVDTRNRELWLVCEFGLTQG